MHREFYKRYPRTDETVGFFSRVDAHLTTIYEKWAKRIGVPQDAIDREFEQLVKSKK